MCPSVTIISPTRKITSLPSVMDRGKHAELSAAYTIQTLVRNETRLDDGGVDLKSDWSHSPKMSRVSFGVIDKGYMLLEGV